MHLYTIERHSHGWLICGTLVKSGIPMNALSECFSLKLFPKSAGVWPGIGHHYNVQSTEKNVCLAVASLTGVKAWEKEIAESLFERGLDPQTQWWEGTDVGLSSAAMFGVLGNVCAAASLEYSDKATPRDADDFGRCKRLLDKFPEWKARLGEVAVAYPDTKWPAIVSRWDEIAAGNPERQTQILHEI